jgi:hypothetical protein
MQDGTTRISHEEDRKDESLPVKKGDPRRPDILVAIRPHTFEAAFYDYGASINLMPKVIYEKIHRDPLLYTTICLQLVDQTLCYLKGILEDVCVRVGQSNVPTDFVVVVAGSNEKAPDFWTTLVEHIKGHLLH